MVVAKPDAFVRLLFRKNLVYLCLLLVLGAACGKQSSQLNAGEETKDEIDAQSISHKVPDVPRRMLIKEVEWGQKKTSSMGVNTSFAGSTFAVETEINLIKRFGMSVWMFAPGTGEALIDDGEVFLGNTKERPYNFICRYQGFLDFDPKVREKLSLFGNGLANENTRKDTTGVVQSSESFAVEIGARWPDIFKRCQEYAEQTNMMQSVENDLNRMTKGLIYHDDKSACMTDNHCEAWHDTLLPSVKEWTVPSCQKNERNGQRYCSIAGKKNTACSLYDESNKKLLTSGMFEYKCHPSLQCKPTQKGGWFTNGQIYSAWKAECR